MPGLRERKRHERRSRIAAAARSLFVERGFDAVTVAEVADRADVSLATVFNYFPTKEDLFFAGLQDFENRLIDAVRERRPGQSAIDAFRRVLLASSSRLAGEAAAEMIRRAGRVIAESRGLQRREHEIMAAHSRRLAEVLAGEAGVPSDDPEARVAADALIAVHRAVLDQVRAQAASGLSGPRLAKAARAAAERGFRRLENGLADYAVRTGSDEGT